MRRCIQEKEYGRTDKDGAQCTVEPTRLSASHVLYNELGVAGSKEPLPVQQGSQ